MQTISYELAREQIKDGDHIAVCGTDLKAKVIWLFQWLAGLPFPSAKHCGIAYWSSGRLYMAHIVGTGNASIYLSQLKDHILVVSATPVPFDHLNLDEALESHINYAFLDLIPAGFRLLFSRITQLSKHLKFSSKEPMFCSQFTPFFYQLGGWRTDLPRDPSPSEMIQALGVKFVIKG